MTHTLCQSQHAVPQLYMRWLVLGLLCLLLGACAPRAVMPPPMGGEIADLALPQDLQVYADAAGATTPLLTPAEQAAHWERYRKLYFAPWQAKKAAVSAADAFGALRSGGYAENLLRRTEADLAALRANSWQESYPNRLYPGVVLRDTPLRAAPTLRPRFADPSQAGEGYPFDMWQHATMPPGMPVLISHVTRDGAWVFVENALVGGWLAEQDVARVDATFMQTWQRAPQLSVVAENTLLTDPQTGEVLGRSRIGGLVPMVSGKAPSGTRSVFVPVRDALGQARALPALVADHAAVPAPYTLTPGAVARLGNQIMGQPYGWGSMYGNRDCSSMLRDMFTAFGVWLPRNSAAQARAWPFTPFGDVAPAVKEAHMLADARPFATLLWLPGHIALYIGKYQGKAMMFHDIWGIRTEVAVNGGAPREGRYIVGRALVSTTRPGVELPWVQDTNGLLARMQGMSILEER